MSAVVGRSTVVVDGGAGADGHLPLGSAMISTGDTRPPCTFAPKRKKKK